MHKLHCSQHTKNFNSLKPNSRKEPLVETPHGHLRTLTNDKTLLSYEY